VTDPRDSSPDQRPFAELLADVAAPIPAPGGGAAAGWSGAIAAALLQMSAALAGDDAAATRAGELRQDLLDAAERDLESFGPVLEVMRRSSQEADQRRADLREALQRASEAPLAIAAAAGEVAELARSTVARTSPAVRGDVLTAVKLGEAAAAAATSLVQINHRLMDD
jgi:formiminotetrahydrofolate cyclodeaminase